MDFYPYAILILRLCYMCSKNETFRCKDKIFSLVSEFLQFNKHIPSSYCNAQPIFGRSKNKEWNNIFFLSCEIPFEVLIYFFLRSAKLWNRLSRRSFATVLTLKFSVNSYISYISSSCSLLSLHIVTFYRQWLVNIVSGEH